MKIKLPWPHRNLSPNARTHWAALALAKKRARHTAFWLTQEAMNGEWTTPESLHLSITFNPPDGRARDLDNMLASIKAHCDGISDALGVDDSKWSLSITRGEPVKGGQVVVEVAQ